MKSFLINLIGTVYAAPASGSDSVISRPVGSGILPGAGSEGSSIQSSILFVKIIPFLINWAINLAVGLSVVAIIAGGYMYLTAFGETESHERAMRTLTYAVIGLILSLTAYGIVQIVTSIQLS